MAEQNKETMNQEEAKENDQSNDEIITEVIDSDAQNDKEQPGSDNEQSDSVHSELHEVKEEKDELQQKLIRIQAEFDNYKKRSQKEKEAERKYKSEDIVKDLLPAIDNFERALQVEVTDDTKNFVEGVSMVYRQLKEALTSHGIEEIETVGKPFDPNVHHAVMQVEDENADSETVTEELQKGYLIKDRVIRPAMVKVNK